MAAFHGSWTEEILVPAGNPASVSFEPGGANQAEEEPIQLPFIAIAALPDISDILVELFFLAFLFLLGFLQLERRVSKMLHMVIDLAQLHLWRIVRRNGLCDRLFHGLTLPNEVLQLIVAAPADNLPELLGDIFGSSNLVGEINA